MLKLLKKFSWYAVGAVVLAMIVYAFIPKPIEVDVARVDRGPMRVTVDQDGKTRVKERYVISAPLMGRLIRVNLKAGDPVDAGKTVIASIVPTPPELLDARARDETEARVRAAEATLAQSETAIVRAVAQRDQAVIDLGRAREMANQTVATQQELDDKTLAVAVREADLKAMNFARDTARFQLEQARAALARTEVGSMSPSTVPSSSAADDSLFQVISPVTGFVLRVWQESEATVNPGAQLLEVGDISDLEAVIDVLSRDAVKIHRGDMVLLEHWGGDAPLRARVRVVEPSGFMKISTLGVEEQRVWVIADFVDPPEKRPTLGDAFRVEARVIIDEARNVLKIPTSALFRTGTDPAVFLVTNRVAHQHKVKVGRQNGLEAEILEGLSEGDLVVLHPSDQIQDGVKIRQR